jgi:hypothetical protein
MGRWLLIFFAGLFVLAWSIRRDLRYSAAYPGDLRNRVVGARLIEDGRLPYFYKWKKGDGLRYYDPHNFDTLMVSNITLSPFYHQLLIPIADQPQARIINYWLIGEYLLLALMAVVFFRWAGTTGQKQAVIGVALLFLLTNAWKNHIAEGQSYLLIPALATGFYACLRQPRQWAWGLVAGALAGAMLLIRPNAIFFFLPFVLLLRRYPRSWWLAGCVPLILLAGWTLGSHRQRELWLDYRHMAAETIKLHQHDHPTLAVNDADPRYAFWEGIDKPAADRLSDTGIERVRTENGNVFEFVYLVFHRFLPAAVWTAAALLLIAAACGFFYVFHRPMSSVSLAQMAIFGFCLYMITDLFSPIYRYTYNEVQWLFPIFLAAATAQRRYRVVYAIIGAGLLLGIVHLSFVKMENTIGEYAILASLLGLSLLPERVWPPNPTPTSPPVAA